MSKRSFKNWVSDNEAKKELKYKNKKTPYNGVIYDSIKEAEYAQKLDWMKLGGLIKGWTRQVEIKLVVNGYLICKYYCDFKIENNEGGFEYHEVKGVALSAWRIKWKLLKALIDSIEPGAILILIR